MKGARDREIRVEEEVGMSANSIPDVADARVSLLVSFISRGSRDGFLPRHRRETRRELCGVFTAATDDRGRDREREKEM